MAHPRAGQPALPEDLIDVDAVISAYYDLVPDPSNPDQQVTFGTSGHRGSSLDTAFNDAHIAATTQAIVEYRASQGITGAALHRERHPRAFQTCLNSSDRGLAGQRSHRLRRGRRGLHANAGSLPRDRRAQRDSYCKQYCRRHRCDPLAQPTPRWRLQVQPAPWWSSRHRCRRAPSPARANALLTDGSAIRRRPYADVVAEINRFDYLGAYCEDLVNALNLKAVREAGVHIGADPMGGASVQYWGYMAENLGLDLTVVDPRWIRAGRS